MSKRNLAVKVAALKGYIVSGDGVLWYKGNIVNGYVSTTGYKVTTIRGFNGKNLMLLTHKLQAYQKFSDTMFSMQVRHLDGDKLNNSWKNIEIGTPSDNQMDIPAHDRHSRSITAASHLVKYNSDEIRNDHNRGMSYSEIMKKYGISSKGTVSHIINKRQIIKPLIH